MPLNSVAVIGLGLIGGSLLRRAARTGPATGYDADPPTRAAAESAGYRVAGSVAEAIADADLVVVAVPLPAIRGVLGEIRGFGGLVTDVTSVKGPVDALVAECAPGIRWVGGHPMAGREQSGFAAGDASLFDQCAWVLCVPADGDLRDWLGLAALVTSWGARVVPALAAEHDAAAARISHAPHLAAAALAAGAADPLSLALAAGSFRDGTRVAGTRPELTAAMCAGNADTLATELDALIARLTQARGLLGDPAALAEWLRAGHRVRSGWPREAGPSQQLSPSIESLVALGRDGGWIESVGQDGSSVTAVRPVP
ncbi:MAG: prephenate dehydrogenase/arogenate dehydrogenase family protein [Actinomycetia bacterium]|nr:prephenate dehydrogenase/arogenate dehydrogenase family protein [Actinomycetes bacterium]